METFLKAVEAFAPYFPWIVLLVAILILRRAILDLLLAFREKLEVTKSLSVDIKSGAISFVTDTSDAEAVAAAKGGQVKKFGNPDQLKLMFKAAGSDWRKSTKALQVKGGCLVQMSTERRALDGSWSISEALEFVPGVHLIPNDDKSYSLSTS